jgi:hypothetical protein
MGTSYFDRYGNFKNKDKFSFIPFIKLSKKPTDLNIKWKETKRLDKVSNDIYGSPFYGWLILLANPKYGGLEFDIPDGVSLRIPFPLMESLQDYQKKVDNYILQNGRE